MRHFFSTLCKDADALITKSLNDYESGKITSKQVFQNLKKIESYDEDGKPYFPEADMTKEVIQDVVEHMIEISGESAQLENTELWDIYDEVWI